STPARPKLRRVRDVRVRGAGSTLHVSWDRVSEADDYDVIATLGIGGQRTLHTHRRSAVVRGVPRWSAGRVTVRALAPLRAGPAGRGRFAANGPRPKTRLRPLLHKH